MFSRLLGVPLLLAAAVGIPYIATHGPNIDRLLDMVKPSEPAPSDAQAALPNQTPSASFQQSVPQGPGAALYPIKTPLEGLPAISLHEVFNMNVSKEWVYRRWARKSTALSELGLYGVRVPLVTGTQLHDLAGSLTYFFGSDGRVRRISFRGTTADTSQLVTLVARQYGLQQLSTPVAGEQLFQIRRGNQVYSELRTRPAPVLWASSPHNSFSIELELQSADATTPLPSRTAPLPAAPQRAAAEQQQAEEEAKEAALVAEKEKNADPEPWKAFFPRSRVPSRQVQNLNRRDQLW